MPFGRIYVSGAPIWTRIGQKSILGHPFQTTNSKVCPNSAGFLLEHTKNAEGLDEEALQQPPATRVNSGHVYPYGEAERAHV